MIAFFAWSNMLILNQVNIKINLYLEIEADLFVWGTNPIDYRLVEIIKKSKVFKHVWYIDYPAIKRNRPVLKRLKIKLNDYIKPIQELQKYYNRQLGRLCGDTIYEKFVVAGFWNDALHMFNYFYKKNPKIEIIISEEGTINYFCGKKHKVLFYLPHQGLKQKIINFIGYRGLYKKAYKRVVADCVCVPELLQHKENEVKKIPAINNNNPIIAQMLREYINKLPRELIGNYKNRKVLYFVAPYSSAYESVDVMDSILKVTLSQIPNNELIIKVHSNSTENKNNYAKDAEEEGFFVDRETYLFESICGEVDFSNKIFITRGSSSVLYMKQLFSKEPYLIFTHRLCSRYHCGNDQNGDDYAANIIKMYDNPQRVFIPNSIKEYQEILETLVNDLEMRDNVVEKSGPDTIQKVFDELLTIYLKEKEKNG